MKVTSRFNIRAKTKIEAVSLCGVFIQASIECEELQKLALDDTAKYPAFVALEGSEARLLGGKPSGPCLEAAFVVGEFASRFFKGWMEETEKRLEDSRRYLRFSVFVLVASLVYLAIEVYDLYRFING